MEKKYGFIKMNIHEFCEYLATLKVGRTIISIQQHHTYSPNYALFNGHNHFELQKGMWNYHVQSNGWADIGQHFSIFPDGLILTGRSLEKSPACITGQNQNALCIENVGNFDKGKDKMRDEQANAITKATAALCHKFKVPVNTTGIVYHHWFRLDNGVRNNGAGNNKSCPGTAFFGGNKVEDCKHNFLPMVEEELRQFEQDAVSSPEKYVAVTAPTLQVRSAPQPDAEPVKTRPAINFGAILRVYEENNGWYRISSSVSHWVESSYTNGVQRATVACNILNVRNAPASSALKIGSIPEGEEVFVYAEENGWCKIGIANKWVSKKYLSVTG